MQFDLKCSECELYLRLTYDSVQEAVEGMDEEGWALGVDDRTPTQRISDSIKAAQTGTLAVIPAYCKNHNPKRTTRSGMNISELIDALSRIKVSNGDLVCYAQDGLDPSDSQPVTSLEVEMRPDGQVVKILA
jgi:hypothetical protein